MNSTKSREGIWGGRGSAAKINAEHARKRAIEAVREADGGRGSCASSLHLEGHSNRKNTKQREVKTHLLANTKFVSVSLLRRFWSMG